MTNRNELREAKNSFQLAYQMSKGATGRRQRELIQRVDELRDNVTRLQCLADYSI
jgi:hypothetical protein